MNGHNWYTHPRFDANKRAEWQVRVVKDHPNIESVYLPGFWNSYARFCAGDVLEIDWGVTFLEADPYVFGSGCVKEDLIHAFLSMNIPERYIPRLQKVVLALVDRRDGREFRNYCRLACRVDTPILREQLMRRLMQEKPTSLQSIQENLNVRRRARWVLEALAQKDRMGNNQEKRI